MKNKKVYISHSLFQSNLIAQMDDKLVAKRDMCKETGTATKYKIRKHNETTV